MKRYPIVFSISGTDTIGGAGSQADIKTISALGVYAASAVTAITVRNTTGLKAIYRVPQESIKEQISTVMEDIIPDIVKLGLLNDIETIRTVGDCIRKYHPPYVVYDPIILAPDGERFMTDEVNKVIEKELLPFVNLVVLNRREAELLTSVPINSITNMRQSAEVFTQKYNISVLIKGGNLQDNNIYDILRTPADEEWIFSDSIVKSRNRHGAGCTFSAAISAYLALGDSIHAAVSQARDFVRDAIIHGKDVFLGSGEGPVCHNFAPIPMTYICHKTQKPQVNHIPFEL